MPDKINGVIHSLYDAAVEPDRWQAALDRLGDVLGNCAAGMTVQCKSTGPRPLAYSRLDPQFTELMGKQYFTSETNNMVALMERLPPALPFRRPAVISDDDYSNSGIYQEVFRPQGLAHAAIACAHRSGNHFVPLGIFYRTSSMELGDVDFSLLQLVLPHLERALHIHLRIKVAETSRMALDDVLDRLPVGVVFIDPIGRVCKLNRMAEFIIRAEDGISLRCGQLHAASLEDNTELYGLIKSALGVVTGSGIGAGGGMAISRPSLAQALAVLVAPLPAREGWPEAPAGVIVFLTDPELRASPTASALVELFDLTPTQAKITTLLASGLNIEEAASRLCMEKSTARWHLKKIFERTNTTRQPDLVRMILTSAASMSFGA